MNKYISNIFSGEAVFLDKANVDTDQIFIGSCTNSRIEDLRKAAEILDGNVISKKIKRAMIVPGSGLVKKQAEEEGLHEHLSLVDLNGGSLDVLCV